MLVALSDDLRNGSTWKHLLEQPWIKPHVSLASLTTFGVGGETRWLAKPENLAHLTLVGAALDEISVPTMVIGWGSNLLVSDQGWEGLTILLAGDFEQITQTEEFTQAGGAVRLPTLARTSAAAGRAGLEFFVGIPGTVGGAVKMNAGGHGSDTKAVLASAQIFDLSDRQLLAQTPSELTLDYRSSNLTDLQVVVAADFRTTPSNPKPLQTKLREISRWRREHQPGGTRNAGSVFKNPPGEYAGRLIDRVGLKDMTIGGARVSPRHANFIEVLPGSPANDVYHLITEVREHVKQKTGIELEPEIKMIGFGQKSA